MIRRAVEGTRRKFFGAGKCHLPTNRRSSTGGNRMATTRRKTFGGEAAGATGPRSERSAAPLRWDESSERRPSAVPGLAAISGWRPTPDGLQRLGSVDEDADAVDGDLRRRG